MNNVRLVIAGCGGLGQEVLWTARRAQSQAPDQSADILGFCAETSPSGSTEVAGLPFLGLIDGELLNLLPNRPTHFICAIGDNLARKRVCGALEALGLEPWTIVDPSVIVGPSVSLGFGTYIGAGSILSPGSRIGHHVVVNHACSIGHDSVLGNYSQACPGTRVSGWASIGEGAMLGSNAVVAPKVSIGAWSILGAASLANRDVPTGVTALGTPAKIVFQKPQPPTR
jgi:sugar O-acyltransferase (sialic acid O-acetyltransferase NeuD family)